MTVLSDREIKNPHGTFVKTRFLLPSLTKAEKKVAVFLLEKPDLVLGLTLAEFAEAAGSSQASVLRFCQKLGLEGFSELKLHLTKELSVKQPDVTSQEVSLDDSFAEIMEKVFLINIQTLQDTLALNAQNCEEALNALLTASRVIFFGMGDAIIPCYFADIKFKRLGINSQVHSDPDLQLTMASLLEPGDVAFAVSHSGRSRTIVEAMRLAKERKATTISITKYEKSPLTKVSDITIFTATVDTTLGKEIIARRVAEQAILESLYLGLLAKKRQQYEKNLKITTEVIKFNKL
ncbi:MurR/RpiR family transcriptional regulator [Capillibacterium thermochitinicola]|uniref:MurR/RpiR family transcriptional regulator n=1 Tax=Capillibacterium thermochitinicola TaxID=2699427 RepID=A0A8J6HZT6_9FIRM|nr:MurR/RpiR family transcriptional regulator [Capillibacterium thermochitinicola]MBA2132159.1 MurR/RpiR family transcriptional regulator [Capillibacterium thermochitinicola]